MKIKAIVALSTACLITSSALAAQIESKNVSAVATPMIAGSSANPNLPYIHAPFVFASPFLEGARSAYNASDLISNWSSINEDLAILQAQKKHANTLELMGVPYPDRPIISISGYVEGRVWGANDYNAPTRSDINLSNAELDVLAQMTPWASAFMALAYDNADQPTGPRYGYSNVYLSRAFLTIGNLDKIPLYATIGQLFVPFGRYSSNMISDPVTKTMARTKDRALVLGFYKNGLNITGYTFRGDSFEGKASGINNGGANVEYKFKAGSNFKGTVGTGYIYNIADAGGMQKTSGINPMIAAAKACKFVGFGSTPLGCYDKKASENLAHAVDAGDVYTKLEFGKIENGKFDLTGEYLSSLESFAQKDLMFNNHGAKPSALNLEASYHFLVKSKPMFLAAAYGQTQEALALALPQKSYVGTIGTSLFRSTVQKLEFRHELNYNYGDVASGGGQSGIITTTAKRVRNVGTFQIDVYF